MLNNTKALFGIYSYGYLMFGLWINCMGPIIPYLSQASGRVQTQFSFLFFTRACGYLAAGVLNRYMANTIPLHKQLCLMHILGGISFILLSLTYNLWYMGILMFLGACFCCNISAITMACVAKLFKNNRQDFWLQMLNFTFAVGGFIAPFLTINFGANSIFVIGVFVMIGGPFLYFLPELNMEEIHGIDSKEVSMTLKSEILLALNFFLLIGLEIGFVSWVPTYLLIKGVTSMQTAALVPSVFWFTNVTFRIILLFVRGSVAQRGTVLLLMSAITTIFVTICAYLGYQFFAAFFGAFVIGACLSVIYPLYMALPGQYGIMINQKNTAHFTVASSIGEAVVTTNIGYAMQLISPFMLFVCSSIIGVLLYFSFIQTVQSFEEQQKNNEELKFELLQTKKVQD